MNPKQKKFLVYDKRLRAETKGMERPVVSCLDWNREPKDVYNDTNSLIVVAIPNQFRIFGKVHYQWKMLFKRKYPPGKVICVKWNPIMTSILALGRVSSVGECFIEFFEWQNQDRNFKRVVSHMVSENGILTSMCWNSDGTSILSTIHFDDGNEESIICILHNPTDAACHQEIIRTKYKESFCAVFKPHTTFIFSTSNAANSMQVWSNEDGKWRIVKNIPNVARNVSAMSFNPTGQQLAAIGDELKIWWCEDNLGEDGKVKVELKSMKLEGPLTDNQKKGGVEKAKWDVHMSNLVSLDFSRDGFVVAGSRYACISVHARKKVPGGRYTPFRAVCFQWQNVQQYNYDGAITCVANNPACDLRACPEVASAGTDGIVSLWKISHAPCSSTRNELIDKMCYLPDWEFTDQEWQDFKAGQQFITDIQSIDSIATDISEGEMVEGDASEASDANEGSIAEDEASEATSTKAALVERDSSEATGMTDVLVSTEDQSQVVVMLQDDDQKLQTNKDNSSAGVLGGEIEKNADQQMRDAYVKQSDLFKNLTIDLKNILKKVDQVAGEISEIKESVGLVSGEVSHLHKRVDIVGGFMAPIQDAVNIVQESMLRQEALWNKVAPNNANSKS